MTGQPLSEERYIEVEGDKPLVERTVQYFTELRASLKNGLDVARDVESEIDRLRAENARLEAERSPDNVRHEEVVRDYVAQLEDLDRERYEAQAKVARLEAELFAVRHNKREAEKQVARLEAAGDRLAEFLDEAADAWPRENKYDVPLHAWRALRGGREQA